MNPLRSVWDFFTSLRLMVATLALSIVLVFIGTVAQADEGLYQAQSRYFKQWIVWGLTLWGHKLPVPFPGGYLLGTVLLVNLAAAHIKQSLRLRYGVGETLLHHGAVLALVWLATNAMLKAPVTGFLFFVVIMLLDLFLCATTGLRNSETARRLGLNFTHFGVVALLAGQLATDMFAQESHMSFREGETRSWSEGHRESELVFLSDAGDGRDRVVAIPETIVAQKGEIAHPELPFTVKIKDYGVNADIRQRAPVADSGEPPATKGSGARATVVPLPETKEMDKRNFPFAVIDVAPKSGGSLGTWLVSPLLNEEEITVDGRTFRAALRSTREYHPFSVTLLKTTHEVYRGTEIPKNFQSRVRVENAAANEKREVDIYMNNPLRYLGLTFFQYQMGQDERRSVGTSTLQVVRNPSWFTPYLGCAMVAYGMTRHFLLHLLAFLRKREPAATVVAKGTKKAAALA